MQMKSLAFGIALLIGVSAGPVVSSAEAAPLKTSTTVESRTTYSKGSAEASSVLDWVKAHSPAYAPITSAGEISVVLKQIAPRFTARSASEGPPVALPASGQQGEEITITNRHSDGTIETWAYTWRDSGWVLVEYHFKDGYNPENVK